MKTYFFVFCKEDLLLERTADGSFTIPLQEEPPTEVKPWTHVMTVSYTHLTLPTNREV